MRGRWCLFITIVVLQTAFLMADDLKKGIEIDIHRKEYQPGAAEGTTAFELNDAAADQLKKGGHVAEARKTLEKALGVVGNDRLCRAAILANLGTAEWYGGQFDEALKQYKDALDLVHQIQAETAPQQPVTYDSVDASKQLYSCHSRELTETPLRARIGATYLRITSPDLHEAKNQYDAIARNDPAGAQRGEPLDLLENIAVWALRRDEALANETATLLLRIAPGHVEHDPSAHRILGELAQSHGDHANAVRHLQAALRFPRTSRIRRTKVLRILAKSQLALGQTAAGLASFDSAIAEAGRDAQDRSAALFDRGLARLDANDEALVDGAEADLDEAQRLDRKLERGAQILFYRAVALARHEQYDRVAPLLEKLVELLIRNGNLASDAGIDSLRDVRVRLAVAQAQTDRIEYAIATFDDALITPGRTGEREIYQRIGTLHFKKQNYGKAKDSYEQALGLTSDRQPDLRRTLYALLSDCYVNLNDAAAAADAADKALAIGYSKEDVQGQTAKEHAAVLKNSVWGHNKQGQPQRIIELYGALTSMTDQDRVALGDAYRALTPPDLNNALSVYKGIVDEQLRYEKNADIYIAQAHTSFCSYDYDAAARWYDKMRDAANALNKPGDAALAEKRSADMHLNEVMYEYYRAGGEIPSPSDAQRTRLRTIDAQYERLDGRLTDGAEKRKVIVSRGDLAFFAYDWDTAEKWYRDPFLSSRETDIVAPRLKEIAQLRIAQLQGNMKPYPVGADFQQGCR
jgi:tetratricopeptide (TPR) repeat protein